MRHFVVAVMVLALHWAFFLQSPVWAQSAPTEPVPDVSSPAQGAAAHACGGHRAWSCHAETAGCPAASAAACTASPGLNLNLASTTASLMAPSYMTAPVNVNLAGVLTAINPGSAITPAQMIALHQVMRTGVQTLVLNSFGAAESGTFTLGTRMSQMLNSLTIPEGVTVLARASMTGPINLAGDLVNSGSLYLYSTNPALSAASVNALNILNNQGAILSTILPANLQASLPSALSNLSLNLSAINNIVNAGTISSAANLNLYAGGSITNALSPGATGPNPIMRAMQSLSLTSLSGNITNAGLMAANFGNINVMTAQTANLTMNNLGGVLQALNGSINFREQGYSGAANISLTGGDYLSQVLNFHGGHGSVDISVNNVTGVLNAWAQCARIAADSPLLQLGVIDASGDPYVTVTGNLDISSTTYSPYLVAIAGESIFTSQSNTSLVTGGGNLVLIAGAIPVDASGSCANCITVDRSESGGDIYLTTGASFVTASPLNSQDIIAIGTSNNSGNAGNLTLIAFADSETSQTVGGHVFLPAAVQINTDGSGNGVNGNLTIIAEAASGTFNAMNIGNINSQSTTFGNGGGGTVNLTVSTPDTTALINTTNGNVTGSFVTSNLQNGALTVGNIVTGGAGSDVTHAAGSIMVSTGGAVNAGALNAAGASANGGGSNGSGQNGGNGSNITLSAGGIITTGSILSFGAGGGGGGGASSSSSLVGGAGGNGGEGGDISISTSSVSANAISVTGDVNSSGGGGGGGGGGAAQGGLNRPTGLGGSGGAGGAAGSIDLSAPAAIVVSGNLYSAGGGAGGAGGAGENGGSFDNAGGGGGGGGGSYGGSGAGGGGGVGHINKPGQGSQSGFGGGSGFGYSSGSWGGNGFWSFPSFDSGGGGGGGGGFDQAFTNVGIGPGGFGGSGGALFSVNAQNGFNAGTAGHTGASNTISLAVGGVSVGGVINAVGSTVSFIPNNVSNIYLGTTGSTSGILYIDSALLDQVTASNIVIGSLSYGGIILVQDSIDAAASLSLFTNSVGGIDEVSGTITTSILVMNAGYIGTNPVITDVTNLSATSTSGDVNIFNAGNVYVGNSGAASGYEFDLVSNGSIIIQTPIIVTGSTGVIDLEAVGVNANISNQPGGRLQAQTIYLQAGGTVGVTSTPLLISAGASGNVVTIQVDAVQATLADTIAGDTVNIASMVVSSTVFVFANGSIVVAQSGAMENQGLTLTASAGSNGSIQITSPLDISGSIKITADGAGTIAISDTIESQDNDITLTASNIVATALVYAGQGTVYLIPTSNEPIVVNGTTSTPAGTFYVTGGGAGLLDQIVAAKVVIGSPSLTGSTTLANPLSLGIGNYAFDVQFANNGPFFANGNAINMNFQSLAIASNGEIFLSSVQAINGSVTLISGRSITFTNIDTSSSISDGGNIVMVAGAHFGYSGSTIIVDGQSSLGGSILQNPGGNTLQSFSTVSAGGKIVMVANESSAGGDGTGTIVLQPLTVIYSNGVTTSGDVVVIAGGNTGSSAAISINGINTSGGTAGSGNIVLVSADSSATTNDPVSINSDTGAFTGEFCCGPIQNGSVFVNSLVGNGGSTLTLKAGNTAQVSSISLDGGAGQNGGSLVFISGFKLNAPQGFAFGGPAASRIASLSVAPGSGATTYGDIKIVNYGPINILQVLRAEKVELNTPDLAGSPTGPITDAGAGAGPTPSIMANKVTLTTLGTGLLDNSIGLTITNNGNPTVDLIAKSSNGSVTIKVVGDVSIVDSSGAGTDKVFDLRTASGGGGSIQINHDIIVDGSSGLIHLDADGAGTITRPGGLGTLFANTVDLVSDTGDLGSDPNPIDMQTPNVTFSTIGSIYLQTVGSHVLPVVSKSAAQTFSFRTSADISGNASITLANNGSNPTISAGTVKLFVSANNPGFILQQAGSGIASISAHNLTIEAGGPSGNVTVTTKNNFDTTGVHLSYSGTNYTTSITNIGSLEFVSAFGSGGSFNLTATPDINGNANITAVSPVFLVLNKTDVTLTTLGALSTIAIHGIATSSSNGGGNLTLISQGGDITIGDIFTDNMNFSNSQLTGGNVEISTGTASINGGNVTLGNIKTSSYTFPVGGNFNTRGQGGDVTVTSVGATSSGFVHTGTINTEGDRGGGDILLVSEFADVSTQAINTFSGARFVGIGGILTPPAGNVTISAATTITVNGVVNASADTQYVKGGMPTSRSGAVGGTIQLTSAGATALSGAIIVTGDISTYGDYGAGDVIITSVAGDISLANIKSYNLDVVLNTTSAPFAVGSVYVSTGTLLANGGMITVGGIDTSSLEFRVNTGDTAGDVTLISTGNGASSSSITISGDINTLGDVVSGNVDIITNAGNVLHAAGTMMTPFLTLLSTSGNLGSDPNASGRAITSQVSNLQFGTSGNVYINQTNDLTLESSVIGNSTIFELTGSGNIYLNGLVSNQSQTHGTTGQHISLTAGVDILNTPANSGNLSLISNNITVQAPAGTIGTNGDPLVVSSANLNATSPNFITNTTPPAPTPSPPVIEEGVTITDGTLFSTTDDLGSNFNQEDHTATQQVQNSNVNIFQAGAQVSQDVQWASHNSVSNNNTENFMGGSVPGVQGGQVTGPVDDQALGQNFAYCDAGDFNSTALNQMQSHGATIGSQSTSNLCVLQQGNFLFQPHSDITVQVQEGEVEIPNGASALVMETGHDVAVFDISDGPKARVRVKSGNKIITLTPGKQVVLTRQMNADFDQINPSKLIGYKNPKGQMVASDIRAYSADFSLPSVMMSVTPMKRMLTSDSPVDRKLVQRMIKQAVVLSMLPSHAGPYKTSGGHN